MNVVAYVLMVLVNAAAMLIPLGGKTTEEISNMYPSLLTPYRWTFMIWSLIYVLLLVYTLYQYIKKDKEEVKSISILYFLSCVFNVSWILTWHYDLIVISTALIFGLMLVLGTIVKFVGDRDRFIKIVFGIYYAWISVASIASVYVLVSYLRIMSYDATIMRIFAFVTILACAYLYYLYRGNFAYVITLNFAFLGILLKQVIDFNSEYKELAIACVLVIIFGVMLLADQLSMVILRKENVVSKG